VTNLDRKPKRDEITTWIRAAYPDVPELRVQAWSVFFEGMAWKHLRPLTQIAVNSHIDTVEKLAAIVSTAADLSGNRSFRMAAKKHLEKQQGSTE
jgi:hypothetical protein